MAYLVGLIGSDIGPSLSPALHEREAAELGLRYLYRLIDIAALGLGADDVGELVAQARRLGFDGLNITHPCKRTVVRHLDDLSPVAAQLGAVNTVLFTAGRAVGHNTDGYGFAENLVRNLPNASLREVLLVGTGGAGAAVARAVLGLGAVRLTLVDVDVDRADELAAALGSGGRVSVGSLDRLPEYVKSADGLINATPIGMQGHPGVSVPTELLHTGLWVADVVYRPLETELLRAAAQCPRRTLDGGGMAVFQAVEALRLFTGREPDAERMYRHFLALTGASPDG
jgi:shikimate dehydrogenase